MSSLIFRTKEHEALVATDTLVVAGGRPCGYLSKTHSIPHLRMVVAGIGLSGISGRWFIQINDRLKVQGIEDLNDCAPRYLAGIWAGINRELLGRRESASIFHFGFSERTGLMRSFAYLSENNFRSEPLPYGLIAIPRCRVPINPCFPDDFKKMMDDQRARVKLRTNSHPCIGGEVHVHHLSEQGCSIFTLGRFDDYGQEEQPRIPPDNVLVLPVGWGSLEMRGQRLEKKLNAGGMKDRVTRLLRMALGSHN